MSWMSPLDRADDHLARARRAGLDQQRAENGHAALHGVGRLQHFWDEQDAVPKIDTDDAHALDQRLGQDRVGRPPAVEQDGYGLLDLLPEAVVEVVVHLLDEIGVAQRFQIEIVVRHRPPSCPACACAGYREMRALALGTTRLPGSRPNSRAHFLFNYRRVARLFQTRRRLAGSRQSFRHRGAPPMVALRHRWEEAYAGPDAGNASSIAQEGAAMAVKRFVSRGAWPKCRR